MKAKLCIFCEHFIFDLGSPHYSELTPGEDAEISCRKRHWKMNNRRALNGVETYRKYIKMAECCNDYNEVDK